MFNPFQPLRITEARVVTSMPERFRGRCRTAWSDINRQGEPLECFLEGPSFDRDGNLWLVDIPFGRIFRIAPDGTWELVIEYDGWPNGTKIHADGRLFVADHKNGLLVLDPGSGALTTLLGTSEGEPFKGLNDLHFASNGDLYFTDQGQTGIADPTGSVFRLRVDGVLDQLCGNVPSPNGVTLSTSERHCYVAATRSQQIWRLPILAEGSVAKTGVAIQLSGGVAGPDGIEMDAENGLVVCHLGVGVWRFDANMLPTDLIVSKADTHRHMANIAFGGAGHRTLHIVDSMSGDVLSAELPVPGRRLFAHCQSGAADG